MPLFSPAGALARTGADTEIEVVTRIVEDVAELLPSQAPLSYLSHENTLHSLERLPFRHAVAHASALLGTESFQTEESFAAQLASGRILPRDLAAVLAEHGQGPGERAGGTEIVPGGPTWDEFRLARLAVCVDIPRGEALHWALEDGGGRYRVHPLVPPARHEELVRQARRRFAQSRRRTGRTGRTGGEDRAGREDRTGCEGRTGRTGRARRAHRQDLEARLLTELWESLLWWAPPAPARSGPTRRRDQLLEQFGVDTDEAVHPVLIRFCAAFLDQGVAAWAMPGRERGLLGAFRHLFGTATGPRDPSWSGLGEQLRSQLSGNLSAAETVRWALGALRVPADAWPDAIRATLVSLRGWAGMVRQFERRPDQAPLFPAPARLLDYLAVALTLEVVATEHALGRTIGPGARPDDLGPLGGVQAAPAGPDPALVYEAFVLAQVLDVDTEPLSDQRWAQAWLRAVADFDGPERRWLLHLAYERRYRTEVLDALSAHDRRFLPTAPEPDFQAVFCMDEREESLRRHLEESHPRVRTYGAAGYFGVAMAYQGLDDVRPRALCPVTVTPRSLVVERAVDDGELAAYQRSRRRDANLQRTLAATRGTLARDAVFAAVAGVTEAAPMVARALAPSVTGRSGRLLREQISTRLPQARIAPRPRTSLDIERRDADGDARSEAGGPPRRHLAAGTPVPVPEQPVPPQGEHGPVPRRLVPGVGAAPLRAGFTVAEMTDIVDTLLSTIGMADPVGPVVFVIGHGSSSINNPHAGAYDCGATGGGQSGPNARAFAAMANNPRVRAALARRGRHLGPDTWFVGGHHDTCDSSVELYDTDLVPEHLRGAVGQASRALESAARLDAHERCRRFEAVGTGAGTGTAHAHVRGRSEDIGQSRPEYGHSSNATCVIGRRSRTRGLYLDRRSFLVSYDPTTDADGSVLTRLLLSAGPVGARISLEYYFSRVDPVGYGAGSKLPHNITGLVGVMDGHASDLRTGMPWQSVDIHEPMRLLVIAEAEPDRLAGIVRANAALRTLVDGGWIQLAAWDPSGPGTWLYRDGTFTPHRTETLRFPVVARSEHYYAGRREHLPPAHVLSACGPRADPPGELLHDPRAGREPRGVHVPEQADGRPSAPGGRR